MDTGNLEQRGGLLIHLGTGNFDARVREEGPASDHLQLDDTVELLVKIHKDQSIGDDLPYDDFAQSLQPNLKTVTRQWFTQATNKDTTLIAIVAHRSKSWYETNGMITIYQGNVDQAIRASGRGGVFVRRKERTPDAGMIWTRWDLPKMLALSDPFP